MNGYFSPRNVLLYLLSIVVFFFVGVSIAIFTDAAAGQGMAGAATVLGYGVVSAFLALIIAISIASRTDKKVIVWINKILLIALLLFVVYFVVRAEPSVHSEPPPTHVSHKNPSMDVGMHRHDFAILEPEMEPGLGLVSPGLMDNSVMYFYDGPALGKASQDCVPSDSLVFSRTEQGVEIRYAPSWFAPEYMKMDYEILLLKAFSISDAFIEVETNAFTGRRAYIDRFEARMVHWPEFLLSVDTVEPLFPIEHPVRVRPFDRSDPVSTQYSFLRPIRVTDQWIQVSIEDDALEPSGTGWIRWRTDGTQTVAYTLLR